MRNRTAWLFVLLWVVGLASAYAQAGRTVSPTGGMATTFGARTVQMVDGSDFSRLLGRAYTPNTTEFVRVAERYGMTIGGASAEVMATRAISAAGLMTATVAVGSAAWVGWTAGSAIAQAFGLGPNANTSRCAPTTGGFKCDSGSDPSSEQAWVYTAGQNSFPLLGQGSSPSAACAAAAARNSITTVSGATTYVESFSMVSASGPPGQTGSCVLQNNSYICYQGANPPCSNPTGAQFEAGLSGQEQTVNTCPASIDALNPAWSRPAGGPPDADGKCPTGRYDPASSTTVRDRVIQWGGLTSAVGAALAPEILARGQPITAEGPRELTGPGSASIPNSGTTTTTTNPDGSTTTTTTGDTQVTYTYAGDTITYNTSNTTTNNNGGSSTTDEIKDPCVENPDRAGCAKLGDPGDGKPIWQQKDIPFAAEDLGFGGACPAPWTAQIRSWTLTMSYQPACDVAPVVRLGVLALTALMAIMFCLRETQA